MSRLNYYIHVAHKIEAGNGGQLFLSILSNIGTNPKGRIYPDGSIPPALSDMSGTFTVALPANPAADLYIVEFQNDEEGLRQLAKIELLTWAASCWNYESGAYSETQSSMTITITDTKLNIQHGVSRTGPPPVVDISRSISIDGGATWKNVVGVVAEWTNSELEALDFQYEVPSIKVKRNSNACIETIAQEVFIEEQLFDDLEVDYEKTNCTAIGVGDGTIILSITGGSGSFSFAWLDGPITQNRNDLAVGSYTVTVIDLETLEEVTIEDIKIQEPQTAPQSGSILEVPMLNSIHFVVEPVVPDNQTIFQALDNVLFANQAYGRYKKGVYNIKLCKVDRPITQFNSDFPSHEVGVYDCDDVLISMYPVVLKEQNIGKTSEFAVLIKNHEVVGQSRVYFGSGVPPIPVNVGDAFDIVNNGDGFDGSYSVIEILVDDTIGYAYLVITLNYDAPVAQSAATARFVNTNVNYNVFETVFDPSALDDGIYHLKIRAFDPISEVEKEAFSEPIYVKAVHLDTNLVVYRNFDNAFDVAWTNGYIGMVRVESLIGHKRMPGGERSISRNSDYSLVKNAAKKSRGILFETFMLPPYLHEKLSVIFDLDSFSINGIAFQSAEDYSDAQYIYKFLLANSSIRLEQISWFKKYNNTDVGSVTEQNFLADEDGLIIST